MSELSKTPIALGDEGTAAGPDRNLQLKVVLDRGLKDEYDSCLKEVRSHCDALLKKFNPPSCTVKGEYPKEFVEHLEKISSRQAYEAMRGWKLHRPVEISHAYRHDVGKLLHEMGTVTYVCGVLQTLLLKAGKRSSSEDKTLHWCLKLIFDYTDYSKEVANDVIAHEAFIKAAVEVLQKRENQGILTKNHTIVTSAEDNLQKVLFIIFNVARFPPNNILLRESGLIEALLPLLMSTREDVQLASLGALANVVPEDKANLFQSHRKQIRGLLSKLGKANSPMFPLMPIALRAGIWSFYELGQMVRQLALNEVNKRLLVEEGALPRLLNLAQSPDVPSQKVALEAIWNLAFNELNRRDMVANSKLMEFLNYSRLSPDLDKLSFGILWTLRKELKDSPEFECIARDLQDEKNQMNHGDVAPYTPSRARILVKLSYNPSNNRLVQQIRDQLVRSGCDVLSTGNKSLQEKLKNVEEAMVIVICISQQFKDSPECQAEVEHVLDKKKSIIPLLLQQSMPIDGWLRKVVEEAKNHFFTFSIALLEDNTIMEEIKKKGKIAKPERKADSGGNEVTEAELDLVRQWTDRTVESWMKQHKLPKAKLCGLNGWKVAGWVKLKNQAPEFFFRSVETRLGLSILDGEVFNFADAIDAIPRMIAIS